MIKKEIDLLPIKNDYVFKRTFAYKGNEDVLMIYWKQYWREK